MLNCQNVSIFKKMLYCLFLFGLLDLRPGNASKFFLNLDKNLFGSLYLCDCSLRVTTDGDLEPVTHKYPLTTHFTLLDQWDRWDFSILKRYAKDSRLNVIPAGTFSLSLPTSPFFSLFLNSRPNEPVRRLSFYKNFSNKRRKVYRRF